MRSNVSSAIRGTEIYIGFENTVDDCPYLVDRLLRQSL